MKKTKKKSSRKLRYTAYCKDIKLIYEKFIAPLIPHIRIADNESSIQRAIHSFFLPETRRVYFGRAKCKFRLPGKKWREGPMDLIIGTGLRNVKEGEPLIVRTDENQYDRIDIEYRDQIFTLSNAEFKSIEEHIEVIA